MQQDVQRQTAEEGQFNLLVDDVIRSGMNSGGRERIIELRNRVQAAVDTGTVEDELLDWVEALLDDVEQTHLALVEDSKQSKEAQVFLDAAHDYGALAEVLETILAQLEGGHLAMLAGLLAGVDEHVARIDARLEEPGVKEEAEGPVTG